ncbi:MAG: hypothetical protein GOVbin655_58 [Prokaryotic dsDNA virus sp.]|nr:MAG: hypothetical protein GOVbin655_58 [Prokaryotic dsDNA virus sp.]|tara:strand:- start:370 stop:603 length:234 start_codon:yes stop_codon:yes gene_type:complete
MINKITTSVLIMLTVWCTWNSANIGSLTNEGNTALNNSNINTRTIEGIMDRVIELEKHSHAPTHKAVKEEDVLEVIE